MDNFIKGMLVMCIIVYIVSPVDAMPGPIDDFIVLLLAMAANTRGE